MRQTETESAIKDLRLVAHWNIFLATLLFVVAIGYGYAGVRFLFLLFAVYTVGDIAIGIGVTVVLVLALWRIFKAARWRYEVGSGVNDLADAMESCPTNHDEDRGTP